MGPVESRWVAALGWSLVHALWQGALVGLLAAPFLAFARRARVRHAVACLALLACLLLPAWGAWRGLAETRPWLPPEPAPTVAMAAPEGAPVRTPWGRRVRAGVAPWLPHLVVAWGGGCLLMSGRVLGGWILLGRRRRRGQEPPEVLSVRLADLARRLGLTRAVLLRVVPTGTSPLTYGLWRPVVLLPAACLTGLPPHYLEALLAHELAHAARWDYLVQLLQTLAEVLLFFHPVVWWLSRRIRTERELLCDDLAAKALGDPRRLALALDALDDLQPAPEPTYSTALAAGGGTLFHRIERLVRPGRETLSPGRPWLLPVLLAAGVLAPLAARGDLPPVIPMPADLVRQVDDLARREGVDIRLLRAIAFAESRFNPRAKSSLGARGLLQVMPETARKYGCQDLNDPEQVAAAGARYLKFLLDRYQGDWAKAVSAYNAGHDAVDAGRLPEETRHYAPQVLRLAQSGSIVPEEPLAPAAAEGRLERWRDGSYTLYLRYGPMRDCRVDVLAVPSDASLATVVTGFKEPGVLPPAEGLPESRPRVHFKAEGVGRLKVRISNPSTGERGEIALPADPDIQVFRLNLDAR